MRLYCQTIHTYTNVYTSIACHHSKLSISACVRIKHAVWYHQAASIDAWPGFNAFIACANRHENSAHGMDAGSSEHAVFFTLVALSSMYTGSHIRLDAWRTQNIGQR